MPRILLAHRASSALQHEAVAGLAWALGQAGHEVVDARAGEGIGLGLVAGFERDADWAEVIVLVDPVSWWTRGPTRDPWQRSLRTRFESCARVGGEPFLVVDHRRPSRSLGGPYATLPRFVLPDRWSELLVHLARVEPAPPRGDASELRSALPRLHLGRGLLLARLDEHVASIAEGRAREALVVQGDPGCGKSTALSEWFALRAERGLATPRYLVDPGVARTREPKAVLDWLVGELGEEGREPGGELRPWLTELARRRGHDDPLVIAIDGFAQLTRSRDATSMARLHDLLVRNPPEKVAVVLATRRAGSRWFDGATILDLEAEALCEERLTAVRRLLERAGLRDEELEQAVDAAAGNLSYAQALIEVRDARRARGLGPGDAQAQAQARAGTRVVNPARFDELLERSFTRLLGLEPDLRVVVMEGLRLLVAVEDGLPLALLEQALARTAAKEAMGRHASGRRSLLELFEREAAEWLHRGPETLSLFHPGLRRFLAAELDEEDPGPWLAIDQSFQSLVALGDDLDEATWALVEKQRQRRRSWALGLHPKDQWVLDVEELGVRLGRGRLGAQLVAAAASASSLGRPIVEALRDALRPIEQRLASTPGELPVSLWNRLVAAGREPRWLEDNFTWPRVRPMLRLARPLAHYDRSLRCFVGHEATLYGCSISADGGRVATISSDGTARVWSAETGEQLLKVEVGGWAEGCAISPDGTRLVTALSDAEIALWDVESATQLARHRTPSDVVHIAMSEDGTRLVAGDEEGHVLVWDLDDDRLVNMGAHGEGVTGTTISADGRVAMTCGSDKRVCVWDLEAGARRHKLERHEYSIGGVALARDGTFGVSVGIGDARRWDPQTGEVLERYEDRGENVCDIALVNQDRTVVSASGNCVERWSVDSGELETVHLAHGSSITCMAASADGRSYVTGCGDQVARLWSVEASRAGESAPLRKSVSAMVSDRERGGVWISRGGEGTQLVDPATGEVQVTLEGRERHLDLAMWGDRVFAVGGRAELQVFDARSGERVTQWTHGEDWRRAVALDPTGSRVAKAGDDKHIYVTDLEGKLVAKLDGHEAYVRALAFLPDGRLVSACGREGLKLWTLESRGPERIVECGGVYALAPLGEGSLVVAGRIAGELRLIDAATGETVRKFDGHRDSVADLVIGSSGRLVVSVGDEGTLALWSLASGRLLARHRADYGLTCVAIHEPWICAGDEVGNLIVLEVDWDALDEQLRIVS